MARWLALLLLPTLLLASVACGGGDDDDDTDGGDANDSSDERRTDSSGGSGTVKVDGKEYDLDLETCVLGKDQELTVIAGSLDGKAETFSASGIGNSVAIALRFGERGYIAAAQDMDVDGDNVSWKGDLIDPQDPGKPVDGEFEFEC